MMGLCLTDGPGEPGGPCQKPHNISLTIPLDYINILITFISYDRLTLNHVCRLIMILGFMQEQKSNILMNIMRFCHVIMCNVPVAPDCPVAPEAPAQREQ